MRIYFVGSNQSGVDTSETEASEKLSRFAFPTPGIYLKTSSVCAWESKMLKYGRRKLQGRERETVMDLSVYYQREQREFDWKFHFSYLGVSQQK